ncbi:hypothetical protein [Luteimonas abyssi]|uniref:hypothetical protein n=1 Tax=Luteimonas abyssi TaxID=1247514 RepID=UPI000AA50F23|nr:hypothetical protein [Luteimonas abyssi]
MKYRLLACLALAGASASGAAVASTCAGTLVAERKIASYSPDGPYVPSLGTLRIYRQASGTGARYCAMTVHSNRTWGERLHTGVFIRRCWQSERIQGRCPGPGQIVQDQGDYAYYAGPVSLQVSRNQCFSAQGWVMHPNAPADRAYRWAGVDHCVR